MLKNVSILQELKFGTATTLLAAIGILASPAVIAQDKADPEDDQKTVEEVRIVGSRLNQNKNLVSASPVLSVGQEEIDIRGNIRIEDLINILPQVFAGQAGEVSNGASGTATLNLRGLGAVRTLSLIDGRRLPYGGSNTSAPNIDIVPTRLIERVDILTGGASAVYGSDAVGGVANFVLKRDFEGFELDAQGAFAQNGNNVAFFENVLRAGGQNSPTARIDGEELFVSLTMGVNSDDGRGNVTLFASYETREQIIQSDRTISACTLGANNGATGFGGFGCVGSGNFRRFIGPTGTDVFQRENGEIIPFVGSPETTFNFGQFNFFQRPSERFQIYARGHYELSDSVEAFADVSFNNNSSDAQIAPSASFGIGAFSINCDNPFLQGSTGIPLTEVFDCNVPGADGTLPSTVAGITASHRNVEGGSRNSSLDNNTWRLVGGLRGTLADSWDFEVFGQFARTQNRSISSNDFIRANVQQAFLATTDENGNVVCVDQSNGCAPYNIFQRGPNGESLVTQEALDFIQGVGLVFGSTEQVVLGGNIQTDLGNYGFKSPFAEQGIGFLVGYEWREDQLIQNPDQISQQPDGGFTGAGGPTLPVSGAIEVAEIFTEISAPLITNQPFIRELVFSAQYRYSDYSTDGNGNQRSFDTNAFGLSLTYVPVEDIKFRGQFQRSVRAPNVIELFTGLGTNLPNLNSAGANSAGVELFDPCATANPIASFEQCANTGVTQEQFGTIIDVVSGQSQSVTGGNTALTPETSDTFTFGVVLTPSLIPGLTITADYFNISIEDFINDGIPAQETLDGCLTTGNDALCSLITRNSIGSLAGGAPGVGFQQTNINIAELETSGVDFQVSYSFDLADTGLGDLGQIRLDYAATYLDSFNFTPFPTATAIACAGQFGNNCFQPVNPRYRHRLLASWDSPWGFTGTATWRYFGGTSNQSLTAPEIDETIPVVQYLDLSFNYALTEGIDLRGGVLNVLNSQAPVSLAGGPPLGNGNTFPTIFDTGRFVFLGARFRF